MNRRHLLKLLALGMIGSQVDVDKLLWVPGAKKIFIPSDAQIAFMNGSRMLLYGIPYHAPDAMYHGTWMGITRSTEPWNWKEMSKRVMLDPTKPLYIVK